MGISGGENFHFASTVSKGSGMEGWFALQARSVRVSSVIKPSGGALTRENNPSNRAGGNTARAHQG